MFDILGSMGGVEDLAVLDLFCGSGALGAEALSRGAARVTFVDHDVAVLDAVRANLEAVGLDPADAQVVRAELPGWLSRAPEVDLALCDPPYSFSDWDTLLGSLAAPMAVLESAQEIAVPAPWVVTKSRRYGGTLVTVTRQPPPAPPTVPAP
jgi:16S rRNA (guanine966-N2)-methyltransferase